MASYTGIKAILTEFLDRLQKGDIANLKSSISSIESVNTTQSNLISSLNSRPYITASNLAETGYVKWSNGLLIQWGHASTSSCQSSDGAWNKISITMPLSYKSSSSYEVMATAAPAVSVPNSHCEVDGKDSGNVFHTYECYTQRGTHWIAIGYV